MSLSWSCVILITHVGRFHKNNEVTQVARVCIMENVQWAKYVRRACQSAVIAVASFLSGNDPKHREKVQKALECDPCSGIMECKRKYTKFTMPLIWMPREALFGAEPKGIGSRTLGRGSRTPAVPIAGTALVLTNGQRARVEVWDEHEPKLHGSKENERIFLSMELGLRIALRQPWHPVNTMCGPLKSSKAAYPDVVEHCVGYSWIECQSITHHHASMARFDEHGHFREHSMGWATVVDDRTRIHQDFIRERTQGLIGPNVIDPTRDEDVDRIKSLPGALDIERDVDRQGRGSRTPATSSGPGAVASGSQSSTDAPRPPTLTQSTLPTIAEEAPAGGGSRTPADPAEAASEGDVVEPDEEADYRDEASADPMTTALKFSFKGTSHLAEKQELQSFPLATEVEYIYGGCRTGAEMAAITVAASLNLNRGGYAPAWGDKAFCLGGYAPGTHGIETVHPSVPDAEKEVSAWRKTLEHCDGVLIFCWATMTEELLELWYLAQHDFQKHTKVIDVSAGRVHMVGTICEWCNEYHIKRLWITGETEDEVAHPMWRPLTYYLFDEFKPTAQEYKMEPDRDYAQDRDTLPQELDDVIRRGDIYYSLDSDEKDPAAEMGDGGGQTSADPIEADEAMPGADDEASESRTLAKATFLRQDTAKRAGLELKDDRGDDFTQVIDSLPPEHRARINRLLQVEAALGADVIVDLHKAESLSAADVAYASWTSVVALMEKEDAEAVGETRTYLENLRRKVDSIMEARTGSTGSVISRSEGSGGAP